MHIYNRKAYLYVCAPLVAHIIIIASLEPGN